VLANDPSRHGAKDQHGALAVQLCAAGWERSDRPILFAGAGIVDPQPLAETTGESFDKLFVITRGLWPSR
jgi:hypothetical protein